METTKSLLVLLVAAAFLFAGCASQPQQAAGNDESKLASLTIVTEDFPPYNYLDSSGKVAGKSTAVVHEILSRLKQTASIGLYPISESYARLQSGPNVAFYSAGRTPERESKCKWAGPIGEWELTLYAASGSPAASGFAGAAGADAKMALARKARSICVVKDDVRHQYLLAQNFSNLDVVLQDSACPPRLASGQDELWFGSSTSFEKIVSEAGASPAAFSPVYLVQTNQLYIAFSRDVPDSTVSAWQAALDAMKADGTFAKISAQQPPAKPKLGSTVSNEEIDRIVEEAFAENASEAAPAPPDSSGAPSSAPPGSSAPASQPAPSGTGIQSSGNYAAALNYKVTVDGFKFANYGNETDFKNLGAEEMRKLFGSTSVCSNAQGACILTPPAAQWAKQNNQEMGGGHCEGMAVLSMLFNAGKRSAPDFGGENAYALSIEGNEKLQREIALWWAAQSVEPTYSSGLALAPSEIVDKLAESFKSGGDERYTIGFFNRKMDGGHAVAPYAIEEREDGTTWILVYDNNYPGEARAIAVDRKANTWKYTGSTNPSEPATEYDGDANTKSLKIIPTSARLQAQACPFCGDAAAAGGAATGKLGSAKVRYNEIWMSGDADVAAIDANGKRLGVVNGSVVQEMPGAQFVAMLGANPVYRIPSATAFNLTMDGSRLKKASATDVVMIGPGYDVGIQNVTLAPGKKSTAMFSPSGNSLAYIASSPESPDIIYGIEATGADYSFAIKGVELEAGARIISALDTARGKLSVKTTGNSKGGKFFFEMSRIDDAGEQAFGNDEGIMLEPNDTIYFNYANWTGNKGKLVVEIDSGSKGVIDERVELDDSTP